MSWASEKAEEIVRLAIVRFGLPELVALAIRETIEEAARRCEAIYDRRGGPVDALTERVASLAAQQIRDMAEEPMMEADTTEPK
jgi:hypothetical protein